MSVLHALAHKQGFTNTEAALADYMLHHAEAVVDMNIGELASAAHMSNATVVRLCHKAGVDGYRDLRIQLAAELERLRSIETRANPDIPFLENQSTRTIMNSISTLSKAAIDQCYNTISTGSVQRAARLVLGARRVALFAIGDSDITCEAFANLMLKIGVVCHPANQHGDSLAFSTTLGPADVAIVASYSGSLFDELEDEIDIVRQRGCKLIVISSDATIPQRFPGLSCFIQLPEGESIHHKIATYYAQTCIRYALECIYGECFSQNYRTNMDHIDTYDSHRGGAYRKPE